MTTDTRPAVRIERRIPAPPHRVFRAWLEPDIVRRWLAPGDADVAGVEIEARVGGHYRIWHAQGGASIGGFECELLELVPDRRLVFRWGFVGLDRIEGPIFDSLLTITLRDGAADDTVLTLVHERLDALAAALPWVAENVAVGWESALEKLSGAIGATVAAPHQGDPA